jgi:predicted ribosomally synthesized peptide with nif11-like leader
MCMRVQMSTSGQAGCPRGLRVDYPLNCEGQKVPRIAKFSPKETIMSIESARAFVEKIRRDAAFKNQILAAESAAKRQEIIKSAGFDFERMHLDSLVSELTPEERDALTLL